MAWSTPLTAVSNATLTAAQWNASVRDNLLETAPAKATTAGSFFVATGTNAIAERIPSVAIVDTLQTTASTTFTNLATNGPAVTVTTATRALMLLSARMSNNTAGERCVMGVEVSGASSLGPAATTALLYESGNAGDMLQASYAFLRTDLTPGSNTFTCKYLVNGGTGTFENRRLVIIPF